MNEIDSAIIAEYDQTLAMTRDYLTQLVSMYVAQRVDDVRDGYPEAAAAIGLSVFLTNEVPAGASVSCLTAAIMHIAECSGA